MSLTVQKLRIKSVTYSEGEVKEGQDDLDLTISCSDTIAIKGSHENWTSFYYTRSIEVAPVSVFSLSVSVFAIVSKGTKKDEAPTEKEIREEFQKKDCSISSIAAEVSLLVSLVTKENGGYAMVTPPLFIEKRQEAIEKEK
jgi:hypothetical protein